MKWRDRTLDQIAEMIIGDFQPTARLFPYRSSSYVTRFFRDADTDHVHDGSTRSRWVAAILAKMLEEPHLNAQTPPDAFCRVIRLLMDPAVATNEGPERPAALKALNVPLSQEGFEAFYAPDKQCCLRHIGPNTIVGVAANPHRPFSEAELLRRSKLVEYLDNASEDELIGEILLPLFRQLGFHRITAAGHKDKALEYGKDVWMRYVLPAQHVLYFGIQAKKGKLDASGASKIANTNVAEIYKQVLMMPGHEISDPEVSRRVLVDHAFIVAGGEITKAAQNWIGGKLDQTKRGQIMFMGREDILNLFVVTNMPLPAAAHPTTNTADDDDELPF